MAKTYDHAVIYNGVFYPAGASIECAEEKKAVTEPTETPKKAARKGGAKKHDGGAD